MAGSEGKIALSLVIAGAIAFIVHLFIKKKKEKQAPASSSLTKVEKSQTVKQVLTSFSTDLTDGEVKDLSEKFEKANAIAGDLYNKKQFQITTELLVLVNAIKGLSDKNLTGVLNYWKSRNSIKLALDAPLFNSRLNDYSEILPAFMTRVQSLGI